MYIYIYIYFEFKDVFLSKNFKHFTKMNFKIHSPQFFLSAFFFHAH